MDKIVGRRGKSTWIVRYTPDDVCFYGAFGQCSSDVKLVVRTLGECEVEKKLRASRSGRGRYDLRCNIPGWRREVYWMRVLGWAFLNKQHLSWAKYNEKEKIGGGRERYIWQVNHLECGPEHCILSKMELCKQSENEEHYADHAVDLHETVFKKPSGVRQKVFKPRA